MKTLFKLLFAFLILCAQSWAADSPPSWYSKSPDNKVILNVELFLSTTCPHCQKANAFFNEVEKTSPNLHIQRNFINQDRNALIRFSQFLNAQQLNDFAVPSIYFCNSRWIGFDSAATTGKDLLNGIKYCQEQIESKGSLTKITVDTLRHWANANQFTSGMTEQQPSTLNYTTSIAFMDSFNPCAFFCFSGFLAFLLIAQPRKKQIVASLLFIFAVVMIHYFQQVFTSVYFEILPWLRIPAVILGLMTLYFVRQYYNKQTSNILYFLLAFFLGLIITIYQQTCVMNWAIIFQQWLDNQQLSYWQIGFYQLLYQAVYILPLIIILCIYVGLLRTKRFARLKTKFTNIGLLLLIAIALCLIVYPSSLSYFILSLFVLVVLIVCGFFINLT